MFSDAPNVLVFALDPQGNRCVIALPDPELTTIVVGHLIEDGWTIQDPTYDDDDIEFEDDDDEDPDDDSTALG